MALLKLLFITCLSCLGEDLQGTLTLDSPDTKIQGLWLIDKKTQLNVQRVERAQNLPPMRFQSVDFVQKPEILGPYRQSVYYS